MKINLGVIKFDIGLIKNWSKRRIISLVFIAIITLVLLKLGGVI